jgi:hypothetical protein
MTLLVLCQPYESLESTSEVGDTHGVGSINPSDRVFMKMMGSKGDLHFNVDSE